MTKSGFLVLLQSQPNPTPSLFSFKKRVRLASAGKQLRNRMQNHTCLQRRAGVRARGENRECSQHCKGKSRGDINSRKINYL